MNDITKVNGKKYRRVKIREEIKNGVKIEYFKLEEVV